MKNLKISLKKKANRWYLQTGKSTTHGPSLKWVFIHHFNLKKFFSRAAMLGYAIAGIDLCIILAW